MADVVVCSHCGHELPLGQAAACPMCGDLRRTIRKELLAEQGTAASLEWRRIHEYYEKRRLLLVLVIAITLGSPFLGLFLAGWGGVVAGLLISIVTFALGIFAVTKVREVERGRVP